MIVHAIEIKSKLLKLLYINYLIVVNTSNATMPQVQCIMVKTKGLVIFANYLKRKILLFSLKQPTLHPVRFQGWLYKVK